ncbi:MAG: hypothetical protein WC878_05300 [Candidatus Paceibacterota bacterium]|jgi:hypothetical protein
MSTFKYILRILLVKITLIYFFLIVLNIVSVVIPGNALFDSFLFHANAIALLSFLPVSLLMLELGIPYFKKCEKCESRWQIFHEEDSGRDVSHPEYEHVFQIKECLSCRNQNVRHVKREVRNDLPKW